VQYGANILSKPKNQLINLANQHGPAMKRTLMALYAKNYLQGDQEYTMCGLSGENHYGLKKLIEENRSSEEIRNMKALFS
jgi:hypothetical protein